MLKFEVNQFVMNANLVYFFLVMRLNEHCKLSCFTQITADFIIINVLHFISFKIFCFLRLPPKRSPENQRTVLTFGTPDKCTVT